MSTTRPAVRTFLILLLLAVAPAGAQVCDGISTASSASLTTVQVASGLERPVLAVAPPGDTSRLFIVQQTGLIRILENGSLSTFLDLSGVIRGPGVNGGMNEEGLLSLAFHPLYDTNGWVFVYHTATDGNSNIVARYTRDTPSSADPATRVEVLSIPHPFQPNHNGGMIAFAPDDGYLYIAPGDGGGSCNPFDAGQNGGDLRGKMLRIDVDILPYSIPSDNPFDGPDGILDEIWSIGLRNPWRFSFDMVSSDLYIADVGQSNWEEVNYRSASSTGGENYGWSEFEGDHCPNPSCIGPSNCALPGHVPPVLEYDHVQGCSITGGFVYRGCRMPDLAGTYFYGDFCSAFIGSLRMVGGVLTEDLDRTTELTPGGSLLMEEISGFGQDGRGEVFIIDRGVFGGGGELFQIVPVLTALEVSGSGAAPFSLDSAPGSSWSWEDLESTSSHPITTYRVYRHDGNGGGTFDCVHETATTDWLGGDADLPFLGEVFSYVVTARNASGDATSPGESSSGFPRTLSSVPCPQ